ncbi:hypothetical protein PQH03_15120 [Ralstonia insidiosa]|jgi:hypothetical protein|uniref:hypothetical protein n=1 Tax=Ralstonia TaxID=48736 RepID=UPI00200AA64C|nr:hypothetical protein [Ralstonia insidiosa]MCK8652699.1 hypothetical protein [Ralstonia insidiosa]MDE4925954.1 hypothetical protein [Ralstonia insidiosa]UNK01250.1 hypothetical protein MMB19_04665 [Ralstonia insidiosa]
MSSLDGRVSRNASIESIASLFWSAPQMASEHSIDLAVALRKIHELASNDGDLGYAYWHEVGRLLRRAADMQREIDALSKELELCRARLAKTN